MGKGCVWGKRPAESNAFRQRWAGVCCRRARRSGWVRAGRYIKGGAQHSCSLSSLEFNTLFGICWDSAWLEARGSRWLDPGLFFFPPESLWKVRYHEVLFSDFPQGRLWKYGLLYDIPQGVVTRLAHCRFMCVVFSPSLTLPSPEPSHVIQFLLNVASLVVLFMKLTPRSLKFSDGQSSFYFRVSGLPSEAIAPFPPAWQSQYLTSYLLGTFCTQHPTTWFFDVQP